jgi:hypothetical protein
MRIISVKEVPFLLLLLLFGLNLSILLFTKNEILNNDYYEQYICCDVYTALSDESSTSNSTIPFVDSGQGFVSYNQSFFSIHIIKTYLHQFNKVNMNINALLSLTEIIIILVCIIMVTPSILLFYKQLDYRKNVFSSLILGILFFKNSLLNFGDRGIGFTWSSSFYDFEFIKIVKTFVGLTFFNTPSQQILSIHPRNWVFTLTVFGTILLIVKNNSNIFKFLLPSLLIDFYPALFYMTILIAIQFYLLKFPKRTSLFILLKYVVFVAILYLALSWDSSIQRDLFIVLYTLLLFRILPTTLNFTSELINLKRIISIATIILFIFLAFDAMTFFVTFQSYIVQVFLHEALIRYLPFLGNLLIIIIIWNIFNAKFGAPNLITKILNRGS